MIKMIVVIVRDEGDIDRIWVVASGDSMLVGKGLTANWQWKCSVQNWVCDDSFVIKLTDEANVPKPDKLAIFEGFASNFKFGKGLVGSLPFGGKSACRTKFSIDACGLFFTISIVGSKFIKTLPLKFGEAFISFWLLASGAPPKTGANFIKRNTATISKTMTIKISIKSL